MTKVRVKNPSRRSAYVEITTTKDASVEERIESLSRAYAELVIKLDDIEADLKSKKEGK